MDAAGIREDIVMRHLMPFVVTAMLLAWPASAEEPADAPLSDKAQEALKGYEPVGATSCIPLRQINSSRIVDETAIIYRFSSRKLYVNQPEGGRCTALRQDRALVTRLQTGNLCDVDIVRVIDPSSRMEYGFCPLGKFTEYRRKR